MQEVKYYKNMDDEPFQEIYFIGVALPAELNRQISELQWQLQATNTAALKPVLPHVTLLHPPSLQGIMPSEFIPKVREVAARYLPLTINLVDVDAFGTRVCFIRVESLGLFSLQSQLVRLLPPEAQTIHYRRSYSPHITLLQVYDPAVIDMAQAQKIIADTITLPQTFTVDSVSWFKRILPREYRPETI